jgi:hypothetical protein
MGSSSKRVRPQKSGLATERVGLKGHVLGVRMRG